MLKRFLEIFIISFFVFFILKWKLDFCLELASILLLFFIVRDLLKQSPPRFFYGLLTYALSLSLIVFAFLISNSFNTVFLHLIFSILLGFDILLPYIKNKISKKDPLSKQGYLGEYLFYTEKLPFLKKYSRFPE